MRGYESFKFTTAFISEIYQTTDSQRMKKESEPSTLSEAQADLDKCLDTSDQYKYPYHEYFFTWTILHFCCCFKNKPCFKKREKRYKRHKLAEKQLAHETDFFKFLKLLRIATFASEIGIRKYQRNLVPYFRKYQLPELDGDKKCRIFDIDSLGESAKALIEDQEEFKLKQSKKEALVETVSQRFDAEQNKSDLAILYEITGFKGKIPDDGEAEFWTDYGNLKNHTARYETVTDIMGEQVSLN